MAKLYSLLLFFALITLSVSAQSPSQSRKLSEVVEVQDVEAANVELKNVADGKCALLKIYTTIDLQDLMFKPDMASTIEKIDDSVPGQIWIFLSPGTMQLTVSHREFEETAAFAGLRSGRVYKMDIDFDDFIVIRQEKADGQYLVLHVEPHDAEVVIDGGTPVPASEGYYSSFLTKGEHVVEVKSYLYNSYVENLEITTDKIERNVTLSPNYGTLSISTNVPSDISINGMAVGRSPYISQKMAPGNYNLRISSSKYGAVEKNITIPSDGSVLSLSEELVPLFSQVTFQSPMSSASIYVNEQYKGRGSWTGELLPGTYAVKSTCEGHRETIKTVVISDRGDKVINLDAPKPMYGSINVSSNKPGVKVYLGSKYLGVAPNIFGDILVGNKNITFKKDGYRDVIMNVNIEEGKIAKLSAAVNEREQIERDEDITAVAPDDGSWGSSKPVYGTTPKKNPKNFSNSSKIYLLVQMGYASNKAPESYMSAKPLLCYGVFIGYAKKGGAYFRMNFGGKENKPDAECNSNGEIISSNGYMGDLTIDNRAYAMIDAYTAGYIHRLTNSFAFYGGIGYGSRATLYRTQSDYFIKNVDESYSGVAADFGLLLDWGGFSVSAGASTINFRCLEFNVGIGFAF